MGDKKEIKEQLLVESLGYLKLPKRVRDTFGNPKNYKNPTASSQYVMGRLAVTYIFDFKDSDISMEGEENDEEESEKHT